MNVSLILEKDTYKHYLLELQQKEAQRIIKQKYYYILLKIKDLILNYHNLSDIYEQTMNIINDNLNIQFSYLLEFSSVENKFILRHGKGWNNEDINNYQITDLKNELVNIYPPDEKLIVEQKEDLKNKQSDIFIDKKDFLNSGIIFNITNPITNKIQAIIGLYSQENNNFNEPERYFITEIKTTIEKALEHIFKLETLYYKNTLKENNLEQELIIKTKELESIKNQLYLINQLNNISYENVDDRLNFYLKKVSKTLDIDIIIVSECFINRYSIIGAFNSLLENNIFDKENSFINTLSHEVLKEGKTIYYEQVSDNSLLLKQLISKELNINFYLGTPIFINQNNYGVLHLFNLKNSQYKLSYQDTLIESICQEIVRIILEQEKELEKQQINIALEESQERLKNMLFSLEDVIWSIHPQTLQLIYINQAAEVLFKSPLSYFFQKRAYWLELIHPQQKQQIKEIYSNLFNISLLGDNLQSHDIEYRILLPNKEEKYVRDRAYVVYDENNNVISIDGIITDITNRTKIQKALEKSEEEFRLIFELAPIGMMISDLQGKIIQVNQSFSELLKYPLSDIINQEEINLCHPDDREKCALFKQKIIAEYLDQDSQERRFLAYNGLVVYTIVNVTALRNNQGEIIQFIQQIIDISELKIMEEQIFYDAFHDKLTGLPNRFLLMDRLKQFLNRSKSSHSLCAILLIDVDDFKKINDSLGHKIGDELLTLITDQIVNCVEENDTVARISGDEFVVFLPDIKSEQESYNIATNILNSCKISTVLHGQNVFSSVSIGITLSSFGYHKAEEMIRDADLAMYQAKENGRNCYIVFTPTMHTDLVKRLTLESALRKALENQELELYYQPIINLKTGIIAGFEALIRWISPIHGFISPVEFIPIAEETGLIIALGKWILYTGATQIKEWQNKYPQLNLFTAVNVSSKQLLYSDFLKEIDEILATTKVNPHLLKIEITETILMNNYDHAKQILDQIQSRNLKISLDDFGTGYSSLSYLHRLPFNTLKIDRAFIQPLIHLNQKHPIVEAIVTLAHNLSLDVVAEGIETKVQEEILQKVNCNYGQGYLYSKPMNAQDATRFIDEQLQKYS
ncbi:diguanylate cyclase/phosphodiesterase with PAS/PAC sensor [Geminocystis sp. NIES-3708]|uniref:EAL domain-containing protein n=1 Tax=Geminocystis sp. NIES-3708 TaxID=1615909 RepID=UPI0005FC5F0F|nr:EAL domain-containing protein [Geminocystis sp. NIES-3708]BAQ61956.1 diguanylate cyclase/phosphodiesterase with PAS/PAC sensor [Geminocystis sp. NIES-3708]